SLQADLVLQPLAECPIAHLIVILDDVHELPGGPVARGRAARLLAAWRRLAFVQPALSNAPGDFLQRAFIAGVVALVVAGQVAPQAVVEVVGPYGVQTETTRLDGLQIAHVVLARFGD